MSPAVRSTLFWIGKPNNWGGPRATIPRLVTIGTNDPRLPTFKAMIMGKVYPPIMILPAEKTITLNGISNEDTTEVPIFLYFEGPTAVDDHRCCRPLGPR